MKPLTLGLVVAFVLVLLGRRGSPLSYERMTKSSTAQRYGVSNEAPAHLRSRLRGLAIVAGALEGVGARVTSAYRSPIVNAIIKFEQDNPGTTPDVGSLAPSASTRPHVAAIALDLGVGNAGSVASARQALTRSGFESIVTSTLDEGNHLHVQFDASALEALDDGVRI